MKQYFEIKDIPAWMERAIGYLELYESVSVESIYVLSQKHEVVGFSLVNSPHRFNSSGKAIAEFYISPKNQRKGYGSMLAEHSIAQQAGSWEVCVSSGNEKGYQFWADIISRTTNENYKLLRNDSYDGVAFSFDNA